MMDEKLASSNDAVEQERARPQPSAIENGMPQLPPRSPFWSALVVMTCTFAMVLHTSNVTSITIALPTIGQELGIQEDQLQWLVSAYSLSSGCLLLFFGRIVDLHGRKKAFILGCFFQLALALGGSFANDGTTLIILRGFQGIGAAASIPSAMGILAHTFPPSRARSTAYATFSAGAPLGGAFGTLAGGTVVQLSNQHWRAVYYLGAALAALCCIGGVISFDADTKSTEVDRRVDWLGAMLVTSGLVFIVFVLGQGSIAPQGWITPYIIALLIVGVFLVGAFIVWEHYLEKIEDDTSKPSSIWTPPPLMRPSLWTRSNGKMGVIMLVAFLNWCGFNTWMVWVQLYYQNYIFLSPVKTMIRFIPMFMSGVTCNVIVALLVGKLPLVIFSVFGTLLSAIACLLFALIKPSLTYWAFGFPAMIFSVYGADFVYAAGTLFIAKTALHHEQSVAGALFQTMTQLGTAFGLTISTIAFNSAVRKESSLLGVVLDSNMTNAPAPANLDGYRAAQWTAAAFCLFASLLSLAFLRGVGVVGHTEEAGGDDIARSSRSDKRSSGASGY